MPAVPIIDQERYIVDKYVIGGNIYRIYEHGPADFYIWIASKSFVGELMLNQVTTVFEARKIVHEFSINQLKVDLENSRQLTGDIESSIEKLGEDFMNLGYFKNE